ncbi:MAG: patatin-like phospholipase family protein [Desulfobacterales bacterium]|nr:patatin-like phospholipase family protein [Desulfobacterales bacterium]
MTSTFRHSTPPRDLLFLAGKTALEHIRERGLSPEDIALVMGASGAAKWLSIYGLDRIIFDQWLAPRKAPLHLFGTSIGAWKLAAAARSNPARALDLLKTAYIRQHYTGRPSPSEIMEQSWIILNQLFPKPAVDEILSNPLLRMGFGTVRCRGPLNSDFLPLQGLGVATAMGLNRLGRKKQRACFERVIFHHPDYDTHLMDVDDFPTRFVPLTRDNFSPALMASGAIPLYMEGIKNIPGAPAGTYRDGGILDYHPALPLVEKSGIILYPHFYPEITPGWFDKGQHGKRAGRPLTDQMLILAPSPEFVADLPLGQIPDRKDFGRFLGRDTRRMGAWNQTTDQCKRLGDIFMYAAETGAIRDWVRPLT